MQQTNLTAFPAHGTIFRVIEMDRQRIEAARRMIGDLTPLPHDCGELCGAACCRPDEDGDGGMYLFPGEAWAERTLDGDFAPIAVCEGRCERESRPLACRIFPLTPVLTDGVWKVRMDARARAMCPLAPSGAKGLQKAFARAVVKAIRLIAEDPEGDAFLRAWQAREEEFRNFRL